MLRSSSTDAYVMDYIIFLLEGCVRFDLIRADAHLVPKLSKQFLKMIEKIRNTLAFFLFCFCLFFYCKERCMWLWWVRTVQFYLKDSPVF